ncbi:MAG: methyltransferase domain-containing protein [Desulfamplus sp.]|nr:methyltransferase domain-containing protein [Desulfamplus sp.]
MLYDNINFSDTQLQEYYLHNEHYAVSTTGGSGSLSEDNKARYDRIINVLKPNSNGVILDFGCGQGGFVSRCIEHGFKAVGIEPSAKSRQLAQKSGLQVYESITAFITEKPLCNIKGVIFSHVLEHLIDPLNFLHIVAQSSPDALVYIEVPDTDSYLSPTSVRWERMYFEHLSHFRKNSLAQLASLANIEIIKEGVTAFSELQQDNKCRYIVGYFADKQSKQEISAYAGYKYERIPQLPSIYKNIPKDNRHLALWGISQYAMLLLGSYLEHNQLRITLFDSSPAKIGRTIKGIPIDSSNNLSSLTVDHVLLLPKSNYLPQMREHLLCIGFKGQIVEI